MKDCIGLVGLNTHFKTSKQSFTNTKVLDAHFLRNSLKISCFGQNFPNTSYYKRVESFATKYCAASAALHTVSECPRGRAARLVFTSKILAPNKEDILSFWDIFFNMFLFSLGTLLFIERTQKDSCFFFEKKMIQENLRFEHDLEVQYFFLPKNISSDAV